MNNLQLGVKAHQEGLLRKAQQHYLKHLSTKQNDPDALQLLGLVYSALGEPGRAIASMKQSLSISPTQSHVLNNLGICQKEKGMLSDARASFERAIRQKKDYLDAHKNLIRLLLDADYLKDAKLALEQAQKLFPHEAAIIKLHANYSQHIGDYSNAIQLNETLLQASPESVSVKHSLALNYRMAGQPTRALTLYNQLEKTGITPFQLFHNKANALSDLGRLPEAVNYFRKALKINPLFLESHQNLSALLWELGDKSTFLASYEAAFRTEPFNLPLRFAYVSALLRISQYQLAVEFLDQLPSEYNNNFEYFNLLGQALKGVGDVNGAIEAQEKAQTFSDVSIEVRLSFAETLLQAGHYDRAELLIENALKLDKENNHGWALLGIVWRLKKDPRHMTLNNYDQLVREYTIDTPDGFDSVGQFCKQLNEYLETLHTANAQPFEQTLINGTQTRGNLFDDPNVLVQSLVEKFELCINDYIEETEPYTKTLFELQEVNEHHYSGSWSVCLSEGGYHTSHVHPMGRLSSAFYVQLPESVQNEENRDGWFKLGEPNIELPEAMQAEKFIKPVVGKLILFQSYMWHGTTPFQADETRMTIAFDVASGAK